MHFGVFRGRLGNTLQANAMIAFSLMDASTQLQHNLYTKSMKTVQFVDLPSNMLAYLHIHTHTRRHTNRGESKKKQEKPGWHSVRGVQLYS